MPVDYQGGGTQRTGVIGVKCLSYIAHNAHVHTHTHTHTHAHPHTHTHMHIHTHTRTHTHTCTHTHTYTHTHSHTYTHTHSHTYTHTHSHTYTHTQEKHKNPSDFKHVYIYQVSAGEEVQQVMYPWQLVTGSRHNQAAGEVVGRCVYLREG